MKQINECPDCASPNIVNNLQREQIICRECGLIYEPLTPAEDRLLEAAHELQQPKTVRKTTAKKPVKKKRK